MYYIIILTNDLKNEKNLKNKDYKIELNIKVY